MIPRPLVWALAATALASLGEAAGPFPIFPDSQTAFNPRVACVPPADGGKTGKAVPVETEFTYRLAPFLRFPDGGTLSVQIRDNLRRGEKSLLSLASNDSRVLMLKVARASEGRDPALDLVVNGKTQASLPLPTPFDANWRELVLQWNADTLTATLAGVEVGKMPLGKPFAPEAVTLQAYSVDDLVLTGEGRFSIGWENGYAADLQPAPTENIVGRVFGFDTFVVSQDPAKRDFPIIQAVNTGTKLAEILLTFELESEVCHVRERWEERRTLNPGESAWIPVVFPHPLVSDVYHLSITSRGFTRDLDERRHFLFVERRKETPGPMKFGIHDSNRNTFGEWPDALPIGISHLYSRWRVIQGPPWIKDANGDWGQLPETPPEEWNWDHRLDWAIGQGLTPYVCVESTPALPWMRERPYNMQGAMRKTKWDSDGGFPRLDLYRKFVRALAGRYRGKIPIYEIENEPYLVHHTGKLPEDYVKITQAAAEEIRAVDPSAKVFANCGIGDYMSWTQPVLDQGIASYVDGFSLHSYTTPRLPDQANLPKNLAGLRTAIKATEKKLAIGNSETGVYTALREETDRAIPSARLAELIKAGVPNLTVPSGWPNFALEENKAGISIVQNAVENFAAGVEFFTFFGWNPKWPSPDWWTSPKGSNGDACFAVISAAKDGTRTPSLFTLAIGVLTAQLEGILPGSGRMIEKEGVVGATFTRKDGGETAVLWSALGKRSVLLETAVPELEIVTLYGESRTNLSRKTGEKYLCVVELSNAPLYFHLKRPGLFLLPAPVIAVGQKSQAGNSCRLQFTLVNPSETPWRGRVSYVVPVGWHVEPAASDFQMAPHGRQTLEIACNAKPGTAAIEASLNLPGDRPFTFPIPVSIRPAVTVAAVTDGASFPKESHALERPEQVVVGRPPELASLQEEQYWKGPAELSGAVRLAWNSRALLVRVEVRDAFPRLPHAWPNIKGSCVEIFLDARPPEARATRGAYEKGVHQLVVAPSLEPGQKVQVWDVSRRFGALEGVVADGGRIGPDAYWITLEIPWPSLGLLPKVGSSFGFDIAINGPASAPGERKTQIVLFGDASNSLSASAFGNATLGEPRP